MNFKNKMIALGATVVVAGGLGVVTVTAQADAGIVPASTYTSSVKKTGAKTKPKAQQKLTTETNQSSVKKTSSKAAKASVAVSSTKKSAAKKASTTAAKSDAVASKPAASSSVAKPSSAATSNDTAVQTAAASQSAVRTSQSTASVQSQPAARQQAVAQPQARPAAPVQTPAQKAAAKAASIRATTGETYVGTISGAGHSTDVVQGSMSRTAAPAQPGLAMTWGGATRLSTTDGLTTEIAGHARSMTFSWIMSLGIGSVVTVTDSNGNTRSYRVYATDDVNDDSYSVRDGKDQWNAITSAGQGEAVVLQTCISDTVNRIVWAR